MTCVLRRPHHLLLCAEHLIIIIFLFINQPRTPCRPLGSRKRDRGVAAELPNDVHVVAKWCNLVVN